MTNVSTEREVSNERLKQMIAGAEFRLREKIAVEDGMEDWLHCLRELLALREQRWVPTSEPAVQILEAELTSALEFQAQHQSQYWHGRVDAVKKMLQYIRANETMRRETESLPPSPEPKAEEQK